MSKTKTYTKDTTLGEVLNSKENAEAILTGFGMHCFGCPMTQMETLEEASFVHGIELDLLLEKLNEENVETAKSKKQPKAKK